MHSNKVKVLILSGGQGKRYGCPKALATYNGETFLDIILSKCLSLDLDIYVVLNTQVNDIISNDRSFKTVIGDSQKDMYDSISRGITEIGDFSHLIIWPVDHPFVSENTLIALLNCKSCDRFIVPSYFEKTGHPILFPPNAVAFLKDFNNLRELSEKIGRTIIRVDDEEILHNINKKEDLS